MTERKILEEVLAIHHHFKKSYRMKCAYQNLNSIEENNYDISYTRNEFNEIVSYMLLSNIPEMMDCAMTLKRWKSPILDSFVWIHGRRLSNGPIEGKNNYIKKIIGNTNGMTNFKRARNRIIYSQNKYETFRIDSKENDTKRKGVPRGPYKKNKKKNDNI